MTYISPSSLLRQLNCEGSLFLPRAENYSQAAEDGSAEHEKLADFASLDPEIAKHIPLHASSEVKLAYDVVTGRGRIIGYGADRRYGTLGPNEIAGTADVAAREDDGCVVIRDFKTGYADVEPARSNPQLAFYALAYASAVGASHARVGIIYTKSMRLDEADLDALDLAAFAQRLRELHAAANADFRPTTPHTNEGRWCTYCPSKAYCPSKNALLVKVASEGMAALGDSEMTPHRAQLAYQQLTRIESIVKDARRRLEAYVTENGPIDLGGGRKYGRYVRPGNEKVDGEIAEDAIIGLVDDRIDPLWKDKISASAIEMKTSKAAIERALKEHNAPSGTFKKILYIIRELGGITRERETMPIGEYDAEKYDAAPPMDIAAVNEKLLMVQLEASAPGWNGRSGVSGEQAVEAKIAQALAKVEASVKP